MLGSFTGSYSFGRQNKPEQNNIVSGYYLWYDPENYSGTGTTLTDISGNGRDATIFGSPTYTSGTGGYFTLDGVNDYIATPNIYNAGNKNHTIEVWVRPTASSLSIWSDAGQQASNLGYHFSGSQIIPVGPFNQVISNIWTASAVQRTVAGIPTLNTWMQIVRVYNGTQLTGYLNGTAANSPATYSWIAPWQDVGNNWFLCFGAGDTTAYAGTTANYFTGRIGVVRVYTNALTSTEILQNYNETKTQYGL